MCFEIHTHTHVKYIVCVCVDYWSSGWTGLYLSVIGYRFALQSHLLTLLDTCYPPLLLLLPLPLSLYSILILSANRSTPFAPVRFIYQLQKSLRFGSCEILQSRRREVINLFNASLIELTLAGRPSSGSRVIVRFLNSPFPMRCRQIGFLSLSLCSVSLPDPLGCLATGLTLKDWNPFASHTKKSTTRADEITVKQLSKELSMRITLEVVVAWAHHHLISSSASFDQNSYRDSPRRLL